MVPKNLEECFVVLEERLSEVQLEAFKQLKSEEVSGCHFGIGMWMRNTWGLWHESDLAKDLNQRGVSHPDEMSGYILNEFHKYLQEDLDEQK